MNSKAADRRRTLDRRQARAVKGATRYVAGVPLPALAGIGERYEARTVTLTPKQAAALNSL